MANADSPTIAVLTGGDEAPYPGLEALAGRARIRHASNAEELRDILPETDILLVTNFRRGIADAWPLARRLQWIHATSAGVDALLFPALVESDIPVTNARGTFDRAIAEMVLGTVLHFAKDMATSIALQQRHEWRHRETERIDGARTLVVGAGSIGRAIARLLHSAGMAVDGIASRERDSDPDFGRVDGTDRLHERLPEADFVVIAAPLTATTRGLFDAHALAAMAPSARLINIGRGPVVVTDDLVAALRRGELAGAALDVFEEEPLPHDHALWDLPNVLITPHMAGDVIGWQRALIEQFVANFDRWQAGEPLANVVDKRRGYVASLA